MKKLILALGSFLAVSGFASQRLVLPWTMSADSVQAVLEDAMRRASDDQKSIVSDYIRRIQGGFQVSDQQTTLTCQERPASPLAVQTYTCEIVTADVSRASRLVLPLTFDAASVQAVLNQILREYYEADQASPYPQGLVKATQNGWLVSDEHTELLCSERSHPTLATQMYECTFTSKR